MLTRRGPVTIQTHRGPLKRGSLDVSGTGRLPIPQRQPVSLLRWTGSGPGYAREAIPSQSEISLFVVCLLGGSCMADA